MTATDWSQAVAPIAAQYGVPASLVLAIIQVESGGNPNAINNTGGDAALGGSYGLMQMSADTAQALGYNGPSSGLLDPTTNITLGTRYLADLLSETGGNVDAAISGYNAGLSSVRPGDGQRIGNTGTDADLLTPFINQSYVDRVKSLLAQYGGIIAVAGGGVLLLLGIGAAAYYVLTHRRSK